MCKNCMQNHVSCVCSYLCAGVLIWCCMHKHCIYASTANRFPSKQAKFLRPQRKSTVRVFQSRSETMAPFIERRWGGHGALREWEQDRERFSERDYILASHCSHPLQQQLTYSTKEAWALWPPADPQVLIHHSRHWPGEKKKQRDQTWPVESVLKAESNQQQFFLHSFWKC